jgi:hypothetical protein
MPISAVRDSEGPAHPQTFAERIVGLAQQADRTGCRELAVMLIDLAYTILDRADHVAGGSPPGTGRMVDVTEAQGRPEGRP